MKITNLYYNDYLSKCDLSNKYKSLDLYNIPNLKDIVLEFPISQIIRLSNNSLILKNVFLKTYFIFYILFYFKPYINYKAIKKNEKNYSLKFKLSNISQIQYFIHLIFIYFSSNIFLNFFLNFNHIEKNFIKQNKVLIKNNNYKNILLTKSISDVSFNLKKKINIILKIPITCFYTFNLYANFFFQNINLKELLVYINFIIGTKNFSFNINKLKNFQYFWIFDTNIKDKF